jgi:large subunit ribosomal protein L19e
MELKTQRRLAAKILKVGKYRIWINPDKISDISETITKNDIRKFINSKDIKASPKKGSSKHRARKIKEQKKKGRRKGPGKRKGSKHATISRKRIWITKVRALRIELRKLKKEGKVKESEYRKFYKLIKGGTVKDKAYLRLIIKKRGSKK